MEKVQFQTNVPVEVALKFDPPGKLVQGNYGDQVFYTVLTEEGERAMYLAPIVDQRIQDLGIHKGERFTVCKAEVKNGTRRGIEWQVQRVDPPANGYRPQTKNPAGPSEEMARPASKLEKSLPPQSSPEPIPPQSSTDARPMTRLEHALRTVIFSVAQGEAYARDLGRPLTFTTEDIRALTATLMINASRERNTDAMNGRAA